MSEPATETDVELEAEKPAKKITKPKPAAGPSQTDKARAVVLAKLKAAGK
jgi:hypothetical protein